MPPTTSPSAAQQDTPAVSALSGARGTLSAIQALQRQRNAAIDEYRRIRGKRTGQITEANRDAAKNIRKPSVFRYSVYGFCAFEADAVGFVIFLLEFLGILTGFTLSVVAWGASLLLIPIMFILGRLILGKRAAHTKDAGKRLRGRLASLQRDVAIIQAQYVRYGRWAVRAAERFPAVQARLARAGGTIAKATEGTRLARVVRWLRSPAVRIGGESIPVIQVVPWWTLGVIATYIEHRHDWEQAQQMLAQYNDQQTLLTEAYDGMFSGQMAEFDATLTTATAQLAATATTVEAVA